MSETKLDWTKPMQTRSGWKVLQVFTSSEEVAKGVVYPNAAVIQTPYGRRLYTYTQDGRDFAWGSMPASMDLVNVPESLTPPPAVAGAQKPNEVCGSNTKLDWKGPIEVLTASGQVLKARLIDTLTADVYTKVVVVDGVIGQFALVFPESGYKVSGYTVRNVPPKPETHTRYFLLLRTPNGILRFGRHFPSYFEAASFKSRGYSALSKAGYAIVGISKVTATEGQFDVDVQVNS